MAGREKEQPENMKEQEAMETSGEENTKAGNSEQEMTEDSIEGNQALGNGETEDSIDSEDSAESSEKDAAEDTEDHTQEEETADGPDDEDSGEDDEKECQDKKEKKRHFIKTERKEDKLKEQLSELNDKVVRQMAEFDNYRKRTEKEKQAMFETGAKSVIEKLLPVVDNFERGLAALIEGAERTPFEEGVLMTYKQLMTELEKLEVRPLDAVGKEFDPNFHNAVMHVDDESFGENIVVEELQKGYTYRDSVVRHSMVKVAN